MRCNIDGCSGTYEDRRVIHTVRHRGQVVVIDHVPAETCTVCGDVLFSPETVRALERLLGAPGKTDALAPLYEYA